jgi:hypothetical protein
LSSPAPPPSSGSNGHPAANPPLLLGRRPRTPSTACEKVEWL